MDDDDEVLDLVDKNDKVIGIILRSQTKNLRGKGFIRAAEAFIQNSEGKLWIPRRQMHKRIAPGGLDYSMGEHVKSGEDYLEGCIRGFREELNINVKESELKFVKKFNPLANLDYFRVLYIYKSDKVPTYSPEDFTEWCWLTPQELLSKLKAGEPAKLSIKETATYLIEHSI